MIINKYDKLEIYNKKCSLLGYKPLEIEVQDSKIVLTALNDKEIKELVVPDFVDVIGYNSFEYNKYLEKIDISNVKVIEEYAFAECTHLREVNLRDVGLIEEHAFNSCNIEYINIPDTCNYIEVSAFIYCIKLHSLVIGNGIREINSYTFFGCRELKNIKLGNKLEHIKDSAFELCRNLKEIYIPKDLKIIEKDAFKGCTKLNIVRI